MKKTSAAAAAPIANHPVIRTQAWQGDREQCPRWVGFPTRESLPLNLIWSGAELPAIGSRVTITMNSLGLATVKGYFHADGYLGVICSLDTLPDWFKKQQPGVTSGHFFGRDLVARKVQATQQPSAAQLAEQARRFWFTLSASGGSPGTRSEMLSPPQLLIELTRQPLEKCLKRRASHLLSVWEYYEGTNLAAKCLAQFWVGSFPDIKLTDWAKEYSKFAF